MLPGRGAAPGGRSHKLADTVARQIVRDITDAGLEPGSRLPNERTMLQDLGVARPTLREAMRVLENLGVVTVKIGRGGGPIVRRPGADDVGRLLSLVLQLQGATIGSVLEARANIFPIVIRSAAEHITDAELDDLRAVVASMAASVDDAAAFAEADARFAAAVVDACDDRVLGVVAAALDGLGPSLSARSSVAQRRKVVRSHRNLLERIEARDAAGAEAAVRTHLAAAVAAWRRRHADVCDDALVWSD